MLSVGVVDGGKNEGACNVSVKMIKKDISEFMQFLKVNHSVLFKHYPDADRYGYYQFTDIQNCLERWFNLEESKQKDNELKE